MLKERAKRPVKEQKETAAEEAMARLEAAAEASTPYDVAPFVRAYEAIDWEEQTADDFARAVRLALWVGAHLVARNLALEGARYYPQHIELKKMAHILAPPKATVSKGPPDPWVKGNMIWLKAHWDEYKGQWVALRGGQLLATADSFDEIIEQVGEVRNTGILVTQLW